MGGDNDSISLTALGIQRIKILNNILELPETESNPWFQISGVYKSATTTDTPGGERYAETMLIKTNEVYLKSLQWIQLHGNRGLEATSTIAPDERF